MSTSEPGAPDADLSGRSLTMDVLLFAGLAQALGCSRLTLDPPWPGTVSELRARLDREWPALAGATFRTAVNQCYATDADPVQPGDEIALIPPVSGG